jgi:hypothetical protein
MLASSEVRVNHQSEQPMLRFMIAILLATASSGTAISAEQAVARHGLHRPVVKLPAGLPRPHYNFRTTIKYPAPYAYRGPYVPRLSVYEAPELPYAPDYAGVPFIPPLIGTPLLPGSSTLPGYYGSTHSYEYQGPYYGGPYVSYWDRLPYACGVYGYC